MGRLTGIEDTNNDNFKVLVNLEDLKIWVILAVATEHAIERLNTIVTEWIENEGLKINISIIAIQIIPEFVKIDPKENSDIKNLLEKYFDNGIVDEHYRKGKYENPFLGFDECALPLILSHNTPNNSLPLLWFDPIKSQHRGLFPRVSRHREE